MVIDDESEDGGDGDDRMAPPMAKPKPAAPRGRKGKQQPAAAASPAAAARSPAPAASGGRKGVARQGTSGSVSAAASAADSADADEAAPASSSPLPAAGESPAAAGAGRRSSRATAYRKSLNEGELAGEPQGPSRTRQRDTSAAGSAGRGSAGDGAESVAGSESGPPSARAAGSKCKHCGQDDAAATLLPDELREECAAALRLAARCDREIADVGVPLCLGGAGAAAQRGVLMLSDARYFEALYSKKALPSAPALVQAHAPYLQALSRALQEDSKGDEYVHDPETDEMILIPGGDAARTTLLAQRFLLFHSKCDHLVSLDACLGKPAVIKQLALLAALTSPFMLGSADVPPLEDLPRFILTGFSESWVNFPRPECSLLSESIDFKLTGEPDPAYLPVAHAHGTKLGLATLVSSWLREAGNEGKLLADLFTFLDEGVTPDHVADLGLGLPSITADSISASLLLQYGQDVLHSLSDMDWLDAQDAKSDGKAPLPDGSPQRLLNHPAIVELRARARGWRPDGARRQNMRPLPREERGRGGVGASGGARRAGRGGGAGSSTVVKRPDMPAVATELVGGIMAQGFAKQMDGKYAGGGAPGSDSARPAASSAPAAARAAGGDNAAGFYSDEEEGDVRLRVGSGKKARHVWGDGTEADAPRARMAAVADDDDDEDEEEDEEEADDLEAEEEGGDASDSEDESSSALDTEAEAAAGAAPAVKKRRLTNGAPDSASASSPAASPAGASGGRVQPKRAARPRGTLAEGAGSDDEESEDDAEEATAAGSDSDGDSDSESGDEGQGDGDDEDAGFARKKKGGKGAAPSAGKRKRRAPKRKPSRRSAASAAKAAAAAARLPAPELTETFTAAITLDSDDGAATSAASSSSESPMSPAGGALTEAQILELAPDTMPVPAFPYLDRLSGRTYHASATLSLTHASTGRKLSIPVTAGSFVRISLATAKAAVGGDCNMHAHAPRADGGHLQPGWKPEDCPHPRIDPLHALYADSAFGLPLCDGSSKPVPAHRFRNIQSRIAEASEEALTPADWAWYRRELYAKARDAWERGTGHTHAETQPAFSYLSTRTGATPGPFALRALQSSPGALVLPPECRAAVAASASGAAGRLRTDPGEVMQVTAIWTDPDGTVRFHGQRFMSALWTVEAHHSHPQCLVRVDECATFALADVLQRVDVHDAAPWAPGMQRWAAEEVLALRDGSHSAYFVAYRAAVDAAIAAAKAVFAQLQQTQQVKGQVDGDGKSGASSGAGASFSSSAAPALAAIGSSSPASIIERVKQAARAAVVAVPDAARFDLVHAIDIAHLLGSEWASSGLPMRDDAVAPSWEWEQRLRFLSGNVPVTASALLSSTTQGRAEAAKAAAHAADEAEEGARASIAAAGGDAASAQSIAAIALARNVAVRGHFFVPRFDRSDSPVPVYIEGSQPASLQGSGAASSGAAVADASAVGAPASSGTLFADSATPSGAVCRARAPPSEYFTQHHYSWGFNEPWRLESIPASELRVLTAPGAPALRLVRVLVPADGKDSDGPLPPHCPPGYRVASTVQLFCPGCNAKRVDACASVPRALCAPVRKGSADSAPYHSALVHKGRVIAVGAGVYVSSYMGGPSCPRRHTEKVRAMQRRGAAVPEWRFDGQGTRYVHLRRSAAAPPFWEAEERLAAARKAELARHDNPAEFPEMHRKRLPEEGILPRRHTDYTLPLQVMFVAEIRGERVGDSEGDSEGAVPAYTLHGAPLYRPTDIALPADVARSLPGNELFWPSKGDYDFGGRVPGSDLPDPNASVFLGVEDTQGACVVANGSYAGADPEAIEQAIDSLPWAPGAWRHIFVVRRCLDTARALALMGSGSKDVSLALTAVADVLASPADSPLHAAFASFYGFGPGFMPTLKPSAPTAIPVLPRVLPGQKAKASPQALAFRLPPGLDPHNVRSLYRRRPAAPAPPPTGPPGSGPAVSRTLDLFAGCGGISEGLHQSGLAVTVSAVEFEPEIAGAFARNHAQPGLLAGGPAAPGGLPQRMPPTVSCEDINVLLRDLLVLDGPSPFATGAHGTRAPPLPGKGLITMIVGGPPCQGYSGMNRFAGGDHSAFKRSALVTFLAAAAALLPRRIVIENVKDMTEFGQGRVIQLIVRCLTEMGYQVTSGIMQAAQFGVPQSRNRTIILATLPGYDLPFFPEPVFSFNAKGFHTVRARIGRPKPISKSALAYPHAHEFGRYGPHGASRSPSAPLPQALLRDILGDLPPLSSKGIASLPDGRSLSVISGDQALPLVPGKTSFVVRFVHRGDSGAFAALATPSSAAASSSSSSSAALALPTVTDHVARVERGATMARLSVLAKLGFHPGMDWRDLKNVDFTDAEGRIWRAEKYVCFDFFLNTQGNTRNGRRAAQDLGICPCCDKEAKHPDRARKSGVHNQPASKCESIIPWSLPHTAHKNGQWAGLYGVNASWGYVPTVITTNSLIGKNGQVLHPEQARVFSVREFARAQGFPDSYRFEGGLADRYKEIGNAVAPPVGRAIGSALMGAGSM